MNLKEQCPWHRCGDLRGNHTELDWRKHKEYSNVDLQSIQDKVNYNPVDMGTSIEYVKQSVQIQPEWKPNRIQKLTGIAMVGIIVMIIVSTGIVISIGMR